RQRWELLAVADTHELVKAHEVRSAIEVAQLIYLSALDRTESRESFYRQDFPDTNNDDWFCWHNARLTNAGWMFDRQPIPNHEPLPARHKSPIAAIMDHDYRP